METITVNKTLESVPANSVAAISSPQDLDYAQVVETCATRKAKIGQSFNGRKGKQGLFSLSCAMVKSLIGLGKLDKLEIDVENNIRLAVENFWKLQATKILNYGEVVSVTFDKPVIRFNDEMSVTSIQGQASMVARREPNNVSETLLWLHYAKSQASKRMDYMLENVAKYNRAELQTQQAKLAGIENKIVELEKLRAGENK